VKYSLGTSLISVQRSDGTWEEVGRSRNLMLSISNPTSTDEKRRAGQSFLSGTSHQTEHPKFIPIGHSQIGAPAVAYLSEAQRIELLIIPRMLFQVIVGGASVPNHPEAVAVKNHLKEAILDPLRGLTPEAAAKITRRMERYHEALCKDLGHHGNAKMALILWHLVRDLLDRSVLVLEEGSALAEALMLMLPMFEYKMDVEQIDKSARKQSEKLLKRFNNDGFFRA
jgi:hypothetical protein